MRIVEVVLLATALIIIVLGETYAQFTTIGSPVQITVSPYEDKEPSWSPDGTMIVFISDRPGCASDTIGNEDIYIYDIISDSAMWVTCNGNRNWHPDWSPDAQLICYTGGPNSDEIWVVTSNGDSDRSIISPGPCRHPDWSPDGSEFVYTAMSGVEGPVKRIDTTGSDTSIVVNSGWYADWSSDGNRVLFARHSTGQIYLVDSDGNNLKNVSISGDYHAYPTWSPDGSSIACSITKGGNCDIYIIDTLGNELLQVTSDPLDDGYPTWSPSGNAIAWHSNRSGNSDIWKIGISADTLYIPEIATCLERYGKFTIPVRYYNLTETKAMNIPIKWDNPDVSFIGLSTEGTVCENWMAPCNYDNDSQWVYFGLVDTGGATIPSYTDTIIAYLIFESNDPTSEDCGPMNIHFDTAFSDNEERALAFGDASEPMIEFFPVIEFDTAYIDNYIAGDANRDGKRNIFDISYLISYLYLSGPAPVCMNSGDINGDCTINIFDVTYLITYLYLNGPEPLCGCVEGSPTPKSYAHDLDYGSQTISGSIYSTVKNGKTIIGLNSAIDIMAMEIELKLADRSDVNLKTPIENYQIYGQLNNGLYKGALFDVSGKTIIESGEHVILIIDGEVEIESVIAADIYSQPVCFEINNSGKESGHDLLPAEFSLEQNRPNPFNPVTNINFSLPMASNVELVIYNVTGQRVKVLADGYYDAGMHTIEWDAGNVASGIYFYRIKAGEFVESRKMILLK